MEQFQPRMDDDGHQVELRIKSAKEKIQQVFPSIECGKVEHSFNTVLVYALLELASEAGKDDGWFHEALNEIWSDRKPQKSID